LKLPSFASFSLKALTNIFRSHLSSAIGHLNHLDQLGRKHCKVAAVSRNFRLIEMQEQMIESLRGPETLSATVHTVLEDDRWGISGSLKEGSMNKELPRPSKESLVTSVRHMIWLNADG
jgi:hypothetical protein